MKNFKPLHYSLFRQTLNPKELDFKTTNTLESLTRFLGQKRALEALNFSIKIKRQGYNAYAMGPSGIGKLSLVRNVLKAQAKKFPPPSDWCYVHNFKHPEKPIALQLPTGLGSVLQRDVNLLIEEIGGSILAVFESDEYNYEMKKILEKFNKERKINAKSTTEKNTTENDSEEKNEEKVPRLYKQRHENEKKIQLKYVSTVIHPLIEKLTKKYKKHLAVVKHLKAMEKDILKHMEDFLKQDETSHLLLLNLENPELVKYHINLLVDNHRLKNLPVIFEANPSYSNLICRVEHTSQYGNLMTNFTLIKPGALHKANGGFLILEARKLKHSPHAWEGLKRALFTKKIKIEQLEDSSDSAKPVSLTPVPIPLDIKVILLGKRSTYYYLIQKDPDFTELFKVAVDFDEQIDRNKRNIQLYARLIATIVRKEKVKPFHASAVAAIIDYSSRVAEDKEKLSTHIRTIRDLILESNYFAETKKRKNVNAKDVKDAIKAQIYRLDRSKETYYEDILRNFILIDTKDKRVGQINCLSYVSIGNYSFGHPSRLTARVRQGRGNLIDIQREIKLAGPWHSKAMLTITNFLASHYSPNQKYSLTASLSFEQVYSKLDGDSASVAEICVLLSAIAEIPIKQNIAITGSVNQHGDVQAIGGVNDKIEGFFEICKAKGLNGKQGVIIPRVNVKNLMLKEEVVEAAKQKKFFIYPIDTVEEAIHILTDMPAGMRNKQGKFPLNTVNHLVEVRLENFYQESKKITIKKK